MIEFNKKNILTGVGLTIGLIVIYFLIQSFGKTDDWQYSYTYFDTYLYLGLGILVLALIAWFVTSVYLIVKGKRIEQDGQLLKNPKRSLGIYSLVTPFVLIIISIFILFIVDMFWKLQILVLTIPILFFVWVVWTITYSVKKHLKKFGIPFALLFLIIGVGGVGFFMTSMVGSASESFSSKSLNSMSDNIGFSVGGAKDVDNFRQNIENDYLPIESDITAEGLFYDYYFDTGNQEECTELFCPSYSYAITKDPFSKKDEYYLSVGLNSGIKESDFQRKKLNLVIVLDISGSMSSPFNNYYYDQFRNKVEREIDETDEDVGKSKMEIANKAVVGLLDHLNEEDRFGMVLFDSSAYLAKPLRDNGDTDMDAIRGHILELSPRGGTNMEAGLSEGTELFESMFLDKNPEEYENRIIFLTDAMPNMGRTDENSLLGITKSNANNGIYTTFIGIGVDFNTELVESITKVRGANYYSVHSSSDFKKRMDDEFEYMVTPLVFNLTLKLDAQGYEIEKVYGSPEANEATGEIMKVNTLFPSKTEGGETKGGVVILKLNKISDNTNIDLKVSYEDRSGNFEDNSENIEVLDKEADYFENSGIRKGVLLSRYVDLMKHWISDERENMATENPSVSYEKGIMVADYPEVELGRWERQSTPLTISENYKTLFIDFNNYFKTEIKEIGDTTLEQEVSLMNNLIE